MKKTIYIICCCILGLGSTTLFAQRGNVSAGGKASGTGGTASFSIGQIFYSSPSGTTNKINQGLQQPYEISVVGMEEKAKDIILTASVYPNPTIDNFTLKIENKQLKNLSYEFFDSQGKILSFKPIVSEETTIETAHLTTSYYFVKVIEDGKAIKTFKIIKF
ncbi:MAG: T9SS type A sorting domain-containing protein [Bacteroidetes bacterium]|nr:T9SS type A sorting domain-containing protein [Bacteroidota bacterium]